MCPTCVIFIFKEDGTDSSASQSINHGRVLCSEQWQDSKCRDENAAPRLSSAGKQKRIFNLAETEDSEARVDRSKIFLCFLLVIVQILRETETRLPHSHLFLKLQGDGGILLRTAMLLLHDYKLDYNTETGLQANWDKSTDEMVVFSFFFLHSPCCRKFLFNKLEEKNNVEILIKWNHG